MKKFIHYKNSRQKKTYSLTQKIVPKNIFLIKKNVHSLRKQLPKECCQCRESIHEFQKIANYKNSKNLKLCLRVYIKYS